MRKLQNHLRTPQSEPLDERQVENHAGGYVYSDVWQALDRFLILGTEGGTYYVSEGKQTREAARNVREALRQDGARVVMRAAEISDSGRAARNDYALFVLALAFAEGDLTAKAVATTALPRIARTATHLFTFLSYVTDMRGWGRTLREAVAAWYNEMPAERLSYQMLKYRQRDGWTHRDVLRLAHPKAPDGAHDALYQWAVSGDLSPLLQRSEAWANRHVIAVIAYTTPDELALTVPTTVREFKLTREMVSDEDRGDPEVLDALLDDMPMTALLRNLSVLTEKGVLGPLSMRNAEVVAKLTDAEAIRKARIHPIAILSALAVYKRGGVKLSDGYGYYRRPDLSRFTPVQPIVAALDKALHLSFEAVEPSNARMLLALDVSGSMGAGAICGSTLTPRDGAAVMALTIAKREPVHHIIGFTSSSTPKRGRTWGNLTDKGVAPLNIDASQSVDDVVKYTGSLPFGGTDCAQPMLYALEKGLGVDCFVVITDSETWAGKVHPMEALRRYRAKTGIEARMVVVGMTATEFTIADPADPLTLDVVGFDTATPRLLSEFAAGKF